MAMLVVLLESDGGDVALGSHAVDRLGRLGVTSVALLRDERTACVVLEGWAFDPATAACEIISMVSAGMRSARALKPVMQMALQGSSTIS